VQTRTHQFVYVLEQTLGNVVHGNNVLRVAAAQPDVSARSVPVHYDGAALRRRVPVLGNWTMDASWQARRGVLQALAGRPADALFVNTQCCAHLLRDVMRTVPTVVSMDATPVNFDSVGASYGHRTRSRLVERAKLGVIRTALTGAAAITTWSHWAAESVVRDYGIPATRVRVIRPGVRLDRFHPPASPPPASPPPASQRPAGGPPRLLFVGGDFERKGGYDLLTAMDRLGPVAELDIVTSSPPASPPPYARVHVGLGHDSTELFTLYQRADIFVVPSRGDVYGLVYPEAMACGLPLVACDVGAARELVIPSETGLLVPPGSPDELAEALRILIESPDLRASMGARGLQLAREQHDADRTCAEIVDLMREVAAGRGGGEPHPAGRPGVVAAAPGVAGAGSGVARSGGPGAAPGTRPARAPRPLLLVSASIGGHLREEVKAGERPCPEYLRLEQDYDVQLVEWAPGGRVRRRSLRALEHTAAALRPVRQASAVLSDGEHAGIPLAMAMWAAGVRTPHVMLGHHLTTRSKLAVLRYGPALRRIDRILVHSANQAATLAVELGVPPGRVHVVPYGIDTDFWRPQGGPEQDLVVSAGREHRDYATLVAACAGEPYRVYIADGSSHSPRARLREPVQWPGNVERGCLGLAELRDRYAAACVVVVPVAPTDFPAGITTLLEAMAMGKAVVVTSTEGLQGIVEDAVTGLVVRPGDVTGLRAAVRRLRDDPDERARLGRAARQAVLERWSLGSYADQLGRHLHEVYEAAARGAGVEASR
jgi:glycosyltransferase involved in cell wall biosynthesis